MTLAPPRAPYLALAHALAEHLVRGAEASPAGPRWTGLPAGGEGVGTGRAGISWFLGHAATSGAPDAGVWREVALAVMRDCVAGARLGAGRGGDLGLLSGAVGVAVAGYGLGRRLGDSDLVRAALDLADRAARAATEGDLPAGPGLDDGAGGVLLGLLKLQEAEFRLARLDACQVLGNRLLAGADLSDVGISWPSTSGHASPVGLADGPSGAALALAHLAAATGRARYADAAGEAARYERAWFRPETGTWGAAGGEPRERVGWWEGSVGIGLARLHSAALCGEPGDLADAHAAIAGVRAEAIRVARASSAGLAVDASVAHGLAGLVELLLVAYEVTGADEHLRAARRAGLPLAALDPGASGGGAPGLMFGLAGVGLTALRLHDPLLAPSPALFGVPAARMLAA